MRAQVNSEKHFNPQSLTTINENTASSFVIIDTVSDPTTAAHVRVGASIKAVWLEMWFLGSSAQPVVQISTIEKTSGGQPQPTSAQMSDLHNYPNKKNIFKTSQGLIGEANANPTPVWREWIAIPKGKQRFGLGDRILFTVAARGEANNDVEICGMRIFKEYY